MKTLSLALLVVGCGPFDWESTKANPDYCATCQDLGIPDLSEGDGPPADLRRSDLGDLAGNPPDLMPMCAVAGDCTDVTKPICDSDGGVCRACLAAADDTQCVAHSKTVCLTSGTNLGRCGDCRPADGTASTGNLCTAPAPVCDVSGICRKCSAHSDCPSLVCFADGTCAPDDNSVAYVDNANGACSGVHAGTKADRFCAISDGVASGKSVIRVFGSTAEYTQLLINDATTNKNLTLIGPGVSPAPATIYDATKNGIKVVISAGSASLVVDGMVIGDPATPTTTDGVLCSNAGTAVTLSIKRSIIQKSGGAGLTATSCAVTLDQDLISGNAGGGIALTGSLYAITNCFVQKNLSTLQAGVSLDPGGSDATHVFRHNTVAFNTNTGGIGGINVKSGVALLENTIIWGNTQVSNTSLSAGTTFTATYVDVDDATTPTGATNRKAAPKFVNDTTGPNFDYHLAGRVIENNTCCIDQIPSSPVDHDYDGRSRPQPVAGQWDVGAHEVP